MNTSPHPQPELFRHVSVEKAALYRAIMASFAAAKRQFRPHLRPDEVLAEACWEHLPARPQPEEVQAALSQLTEWGNLEAQADTGRVNSLTDFYHLKSIYRLSQGGEAVEAALETFARTLARRAELQSVALEDILHLLETLHALAQADEADAAKVHASLRDLMRVFEGLAENSQAFMTDIARTIEMQQADASAVLLYKRRLIRYLERFIHDLVHRSGSIAQAITTLAPHIAALLAVAARREARDAMPDHDADDATQLPPPEHAATLPDWQLRWRGLRGWFLSDGHTPPQAETLRARARSAIPQLLNAIAAVNERRSGRSDRSADFRVLAHWFAACTDDAAAHRLARAAFALQPARHLSLTPQAELDDVPASTPWSAAPPLRIHPRLREYGEATPRGTPSRVQARDKERRLLAEQLEEEHAQIEAARQRLATGQPVRLSALGELDPHAFGLFLALLGEALAAQSRPDDAVERLSGDGLLRIRLEPLAADSVADIHTPAGILRGRDHLLTVHRTDTP